MLGCTIVDSAPIPVPRQAKLNQVSHKGEPSGAPYSRINDVAEKKLQDGLISNTTPRIKNPYASTSSTTSSTTTPHIHQLSTVHNPYLPKTATNITTIKSPIVPPSNRPPHPQFSSPNTPSSKSQLEHLRKEKISLQSQLTQAVGNRVQQVVAKEATISKLRNEKLELSQSLSIANKEISPLKRKLTAMKETNKGKTSELTDAYAKIASLQKEKEDHERALKEEAHRREIQQQIKDGIAAAIPTIREEVTTRQSAIFSRELEQQRTAWKIECASEDANSCLVM